MNTNYAKKLAPNLYYIWLNEWNDPHYLYGTTLFNAVEVDDYFVNDRGEFEQTVEDLMVYLDELEGIGHGKAVVVRFYDFLGTKHIHVDGENIEWRLTLDEEE